MRFKLSDLNTPAIVLLMGIFMIGCHTPTSFPIPGETSPLPSVKFTITSTDIPDTSTPTPTLVPAIPLSPTFTATPTLQPTLSRQEGEQVVLDLLKTNGKCDLPCFWGIVTGKTEQKTAIEKFHHLGRKGYSETDESGNITHYDTSFGFQESKLVITIVLKIEKGLVQKINVFIGGLFYPETAFENWEAFTLKGILQGYGIPTKVLFAVELPREPVVNPSQVLYSYALYYQEAEMFISYSQVGPIERKSVYNICPLKPTERPSYLNQILGFKDGDSFSGWVALSEATTISNEDFYELFTQGDETTCIELPGSLLETTAP